MKKIVVKLDLADNKAKQKAMKTVSTLSGIDSISMDMKGKKLTVIGTVDPIGIVTKLRKYWSATGIILVGPAKEPTEKKEAEAAKKEDGKKDEAKKEGGGGDGEQTKEEAKKEEDGKKEEEKGKEGGVEVYDPMHEMVKAYRAYNPQMASSYYYVQSMEENPNACVLC